MENLEQLLQGKTPVSFLHEMCTRKKMTPTYDVLANEGPIHEPIFVIRAQAGEFQGTGKGSSKKKAKHDAAESLLCAMYNIKSSDGVGDQEDVNDSDGIVHAGSHLNAGMFDGDMQGNPIGELQEYTQKNLLKPPIYEYIGEEGPPHAREFVCTVKLAKLQETAVGKSKKIAKRSAASKLLQAVRQHQSDNTSSAVIDEDDDELPLPPPQHPDHRLEAAKILSTEAGKSAAEFLKQVRQSPRTDDTMPLLYTYDLNNIQDNKDVMKALADQAKVSKFDVSYIDIRHQSYSGLHQCLVQLSTAPTAICFGTGNTVEDARVCAAHNALQYLRTATMES